jgi:hypothetical protein
VTRDPWKSTFREELKEKWKGRFWFSPIGFIPPGRLHHVRTLINIDDYHAPRTQNYESKRKCGFKPYLINGQPWYHHIDFVFTAP